MPRLEVNDLRDWMRTTLLHKLLQSKSQIFQIFQFKSGIPFALPFSSIIFSLLVNLLHCPPCIRWQNAVRLNISIEKRFDVAYLCIASQCCVQVSSFQTYPYPLCFWCRFIIINIASSLPQTQSTVSPWTLKDILWRIFLPPRSDRKKQDESRKKTVSV